MILKPKQQSTNVKFACGHLLTSFGKSVYFKMLLFVLKSMSEKCAAAGSVVATVSPSSCSFLLMIDEVISK